MRFVGSVYVFINLLLKTSSSERSTKNKNAPNLARESFVKRVLRSPNFLLLMKKKIEKNEKSEHFISWEKKFANSQLKIQG